MNTSRRNLLLTSLFGAGALGLRALATGIPVSILLNPRKALANPSCTNPQFVILTTSGQGDPLNANAPGTYSDVNPAFGTGITHCPAFDPPAGSKLMSAPATAQVTLGTKAYTAGGPWAMANLDPTRTAVFHLMTNTPVHPKEPDVLRLQNGIAYDEMLPSFLSANLGPCLGTLQNQPITVGAATPSEALTFQGGALPIIPPLALRSTLLKPSTMLGNLQAIRAQTLDAFNKSLYANGVSQAQAKFVQDMYTSEQSLTNVNQSLLSQLSSISDNTADSQVVAAVTLIQMGIAPVIAVHIPFGGDNHHDNGLTQFEGPQHLTGFDTLNTLIGMINTMSFPNGMPLKDKVSIISLNVFGRTINQTNTQGRQHNPNHQVSFAIGAPFKGGLYGGITQASGDYGALPIVAATGASGAMGATGKGIIDPIDTLTSFGMTVATAVGVPAAAVEAGFPMSTTGSNTQTVITAALAS
jgi:hypothetical protein